MSYTPNYNTEGLPNAIQGQYNQAMFQQIRLHELWTRIERMSTNLLLYSLEFRLYHYEVVFNDLCSILRIVSPKMRDNVKDDIIKDREQIRVLLRDSKVYGEYKRGTKIVKIFYKNNWDKISELLYQFQLKIEMLSDTHGYGNPNKKDPARAILDM